MRGFTLVLSVNLILTLFRILYVLFYPIDLSPEEAQYWNWSRFPDLSYYSKPPMVAYLNLLSTSLLGNTEIGVRIFPIIFSFLLSILTFFFVRNLFGEKVALVASLLPNLFVGTSINSILMTTDAPFIFFWSLSVMLIYIALEKNTLSLWLAVGVCAGLAFLSKYPAVFLLPLTLIYMFLAKRDLLFSPKPYLSLLPAFFLSLPVLVWNYERGFVSFKHVSSLAEKKANFPNFDTFFEFLGGQILLLSGLPFFLLVYGWWKALKERDKRLLFFTVFSLPIVLFFGILALRKEVYANWSGFAYFAGSILVAYVFVRSAKALQLTTLALALFLTLLLHFTPLLDILGLRDLLPPKRDPVKVMVGWEKLGKEVSRFYSGDELIFSTSYQIASELAFYVRGNPQTFVYHTGRMTQYYLWRNELKNYKGRDGLFVSTHPPPNRVKALFSSLKEVGRVNVVWRGERIKSFRIYRLGNFKGYFDDVPKGY